MKRLLSGLVCGSVLAVMLSGCIVLPPRGGNHYYQGGYYSQGPYDRGGYRR